MYYTTISFPSFGIEIDPIREFALGPLTVHIYGAIIAFGFLLAILYCCKRSDQFGIPEPTLEDGILWVAPFSIICARIYYCAFTWEWYKNDPISVLYIWEGGIAIYGAVIGAAIGTTVFCKFKKLSVAAVLDLVVLGFLIGQTLGRWGNFFNREAFGAETASFFRMGLTDQFGNTTYYHPTFLYESVWNCTGFILLHNLSKHRKYDGQVALSYLAWYGLGRFFIEGLRTDSLYIGSFRVSQLLAGVSCLVGVVLLVILQKKGYSKLFLNSKKEETENGELS